MKDEIYHEGDMFGVYTNSVQDHAEGDILKIKAVIERVELHVKSRRV